MDLFADLPEPSNDDGAGATSKKRTSLFDDLPPATNTHSGATSKKKTSLFDDLPPATNTHSASNLLGGDLFSGIPADATTDNTKGEKRKSEQGDGSEEHVEKKVCKELPQLRGFVAERKGEREEMQDAHVIRNEFVDNLGSLPDGISQMSYFAVFDGHNGARAAQFAAQQLHLNLCKKFPKGMTSIEKTVKKCLVEAFKQTDDEFLRQASSQKPVWKDGCTATCVLAIDGVLYIANLGDSRAVLCRYSEESQKQTALPLSVEHNPTQYEERMRIQKAGGTVRDGRVMGILEVSRSIGDGQYKRLGVISLPDVRRCQLTPSDRFILLACDGLFKVFSPEEAVTFVLKVLEDKDIPVKEGKTLDDARYEAACSRLANEAVRRGSADNVTVILVAVG
ncbi:integrin-linked kinase-associated serine/threonine phosphatase 2C [Protopterus annectens]|uniref:integrin-linked kinase-associated serine/threonine phosphatase 2C n=1 Tax=Protopterus annectens TaxID=7888 RepID=UPI001CF9C48D|nr:integrin-linked kinase-associated serine/threonine phosphatase 2C [Protopterus annectens]